MRLTPMFDQVLVRRIQEEKKGVIVTPEKYKQKSTIAEVLAVGPGKRLEDGTHVKPDIEVGDKIVLGLYHGTEVRINDEDLVIVREEEILGRVLGLGSA